MNVSREQIDKLIVGGGDVSFPDGGPDVSPTGTAVLNGPVYVGKPTASPGYEANAPNCTSVAEVNTILSVPFESV